MMHNHQVVTTLGPTKPQRLTSGHYSSVEASEVHDNLEIPELETLLSPSIKSRSQLTVATPPHRLCLETSFTSLQSPTDLPSQCGLRELSIDSYGWYMNNIASELITPKQDENKLFNHPLNWEYTQRIAPLATPETMSEASISNPSSPIPQIRPIRRTPKIPGNLSTAADDLKSNLHFAMLSVENYGLKDDNSRGISGGGGGGGGGSNSSSAANSETSYDIPILNYVDGINPPPVPRRRDSAMTRREQQHICRAACCQDDLSDNSISIAHSSSHNVEIDFLYENHTNTLSSIDQNINKKVTLSSSSSSSSSLSLSLPMIQPQCQNNKNNNTNINDSVLPSVRTSSSSECKSIMAPAIDLGAEWKKRFNTTNINTVNNNSGNTSLPLLYGLSSTPNTQHTSPFFNAKRKKYVYPITLVGRGESSV